MTPPQEFNDKLIAAGVMVRMNFLLLRNINLIEGIFEEDLK